METEIWSHILHQLANVLSFPPRAGQWQLSQLVVLYTRFPFFQQILSDPVMLRTLEKIRGYYYRNTCVSFPEFAIKFQMKIRYTELFVSSATAQRHMIREDDSDMYSIGIVPSDRLVGILQLEAIKAKAWRVLQENVKGFTGTCVFPNRTDDKGDVVKVQLISGIETMTILAAGISRDTKHLFGNTKFTGLSYSHQRSVFSGWFVSGFPLDEILKDEEIAAIENIENLLEDAAIDCDSGNVLEGLIQKGMIMGTTGTFLLGGHNILLLGIRLKHVNSDRAMNRVCCLLGRFTDTSLVGFLEATTDFFQICHYEKLAIELIKVRILDQEIVEPEALMWLLNRKKIRPETLSIIKQFATGLKDMTILNGNVVPR